MERVSIPNGANEDIHAYNTRVVRSWVNMRIVDGCVAGNVLIGGYLVLWLPAFSFPESTRTRGVASFQDRACGRLGFVRAATSGTCCCSQGSHRIGWPLRCA